MSRVWKVEDGQSIDKILELYSREAGNPIPNRLKCLYYDGICTANPQLKGKADHIRSGATLVLPELYKVKYGETFESIAKSLGIDCAALKQINKNFTKNINCETILLLPIEQGEPNGRQVVEVSGDRYLWDVAAQYLGDPLYDKHIAKENEISSLYYEKLKNTKCCDKTTNTASLILPLNPNLDPEMVEIRKSIQKKLGEVFFNQVMETSSYEAAKAIYLTLLREIDWMEGFKSFMYLDSERYVTIGYGTKIHHYKDELTKKGVKHKLCLCYHTENHSLDYCHHEHGEPATEKHIADAHAAIKKGNQETSPRVLLPEKDARGFAEEHFQNIFNQLDRKTKINGLTSHPLPITIAIIDTAYNVGVDGFFDFKNCIKAIRYLKWTRAAREFRVHEFNKKSKKHEKGRRKRNLLRYELAMRAHRGAINLCKK